MNVRAFRLVFPSGVAAVALAMTGCQPAASNDELVLQEAAGYAMITEETGNLGAEADLALSAQELGSAADEAQALVTDENTPDEGNVCDFKARRERVKEHFDTNQDGKLSRDELGDLRRELLERGPRLAKLGLRARLWVFWRVRWAFDEDGNHLLDNTERARLVEALEARCERLRDERLAKFDTNHDGALDDTERAAARDAARARWAERRRALLATFDTNHSGFFELDERIAIRESRLAEARARYLALLEKFDTNQDGTLTPDELLPLRQEIQRRIIEGADSE